MSFSETLQGKRGATSCSLNLKVTRHQCCHDVYISELIDEGAGPGLKLGAAGACHLLSRCMNAFLPLNIFNSIRQKNEFRFN